MVKYFVLSMCWSELKYFEGRNHLKPFDWLVLAEKFVGSEDQLDYFTEESVLSNLLRHLFPTFHAGHQVYHFRLNLSELYHYLCFVQEPTTKGKQVQHESSCLITDQSFIGQSLQALCEGL